jgi:hypothetical protein
MTQRAADTQQRSPDTPAAPLESPQAAVPQSETAQTQTLEGTIPPLADDAQVRHALNQAFDYRGDVTLTLRDGRSVVGYIYDRSADAPALHQCLVRVIHTHSGQRENIPYDQIARLEFTGRDTAAGKSFQTWLQKYHEKKAAGEAASIESEPID